MADCCDPEEYRSVFTERFARRTARRYRRRGLTPAAEWIVQFAAENDLRRIRGNGFRTYIHPPDAMIAVAAAGGMRATYRQHSRDWDVVGLVR